MKKNQKGFTLVELLVVIAILAILATVSIVGYTSFIERAEKSNETTEAHQIELSLESALIVNDCVKVKQDIYAVKNSKGEVYFASEKPEDVKEEDVYVLSKDLAEFADKLSVTSLDLRYGSTVVMKGVTPPTVDSDITDNNGDGGEN